MTTESLNTRDAQPEHIDHSHPDMIANKVTFGFWIYIMTDAILFATLFATYAVLHDNTFGGPGITQVANLDHILMQTLVLIVSTLSYGLCFVAFHRGSKKQVLFWLGITFILGLLFLGIEIGDCTSLVQQGYTWQTSAFLSSYFTILSIHAIHIMAGLLWMVVLAVQFLMQGLTPVMRTRFTCLSLFWNFVNLMWLIIFTIVFLMGAV